LCLSRGGENRSPKSSSSVSSPSVSSTKPFTAGTDHVRSAAVVGRGTVAGAAAVVERTQAEAPIRKAISPLRIGQSSDTSQFHVWGIVASSVHEDKTNSHHPGNAAGRPDHRFAGIQAADCFSVARSCTGAFPRRSACRHFPATSPTGD
jgi:hypothetical protein